MLGSMAIQSAKIEITDKNKRNKDSKVQTVNVKEYAKRLLHGSVTSNIKYLLQVL